MPKLTQGELKFNNKSPNPIKWIERTRRSHIPSICRRAVSRHPDGYRIFTHLLKDLRVLGNELDHPFHSS